MKRKTVLDILGIIGVILTAAGFIEKLTPYIRYPFLLIGIVTVGFYLKFYFQEYIVNLISKNKKEIEQVEKRVNQKMSLIQEQINKIQGWKEAINHFCTLRKNKKGQLDPITLLIILVVIIAIIIWIQKGG